jgi:probable HAF family extracellular repeat protein
MHASGRTKGRAARTVAALAAGLAVSLVLAGPASAASYRVVDLGTLGGATSAANDINEAGAVVGWSKTASGRVHATIWRSGRIIDIGTLGGPNSVATAISNNFAVVGRASVAGGATHGFLWRANTGAPHNLGTPSPNGIADTGAMIANGRLPNAEPVGMFRFYQVVGGWTRILPPGWDGSDMADINAAGTAVGSVITEPHGASPFTYANGVLTILPGVETAGETGAEAINNVGQIAGQTFDPLGIVLWDGTQWTPIPTPALFEPSVRDMNDCTQIVGSHLAGQPSFKPSAFLISGGVGVDLNSLIPAGSGWHLGVATGINNAGQIVGVGRHNGIQRAFLLQPTTTGGGCS